MALNFKQLINVDLLKVFKGELDKVFSTKKELEQAQSTLQGNIDGKLGKDENAVSASKLANAQTITLTGGVTGSVNFDGSAGVTIATELQGFDASKITSGTININRLPASAIERVYVAENKEAMLALTTAEVQNGDVVSLADTKAMFYVVDDTKLGGEQKEQAFMEFTAGTASKVDWSGVQGIPEYVKDYSPEINSKGEKTAVETNTQAIAKLNGLDTEDGSVAKKIKDVVDPVKDDITKITNGTTVVAHATLADTATTANEVAHTLTIAGNTFNGSADVSVELTSANITDFETTVQGTDLTNNIAVKKVADDLTKHIASVENGTSVKVDEETIHYIDGLDAQHKKLAIKAVPQDKVTGLQVSLDAKINKEDITLATTQDIQNMFLQA